jgi:hypothetical protein
LLDEFYITKINDVYPSREANSWTVNFWNGLFPSELSTKCTQFSFMLAAYTALVST